MFNDNVNVTFLLSYNIYSKRFFYWAHSAPFVIHFVCKRIWSCVIWMTVVEVRQFSYSNVFILRLCWFSGQKSILICLSSSLVSSQLNSHGILYCASCLKKEKMSFKDQCLGSVITSSGSIVNYGGCLLITYPAGSGSGAVGQTISK